MSKIEKIIAKLQLAAKVELTTIPTYLYAKFSIKDITSTPYNVFATVLKEEMLHLIQVANIIIALGGRPILYDASVIPTYPSLLPHHALNPPLYVRLDKLSVDLLNNVFLRIELPETSQAAPEGDNYKTLGQFYNSIVQDFANLPTGTITNWYTGYQFEAGIFYNPAAGTTASDSGGLMVVSSMDDVKTSISTIIVQGEGMSPHGEFDDQKKLELSHYYQFKNTILGTRPFPAVYNAPTNPKITDFSENFRSVLELFNAMYMYILCTIEIGAHCDKEFRDNTIKSALFGTMFALEPLGIWIMSYSSNIPLAPTFEYYKFDTNKSKISQINDLLATTQKKFSQFSCKNYSFDYDNS